MWNCAPAYVIWRPRSIYATWIRTISLTIIIWGHPTAGRIDRKATRQSQRVPPTRPLHPTTGRHHSPINGFLRHQRSRPRDPIHRHHYHPPQFVERLRRWRPVPLLRRSHRLLQSMCSVRRRPGHGRLPAIHVLAGRWQFGRRIRGPSDTDQPVARLVRAEFVPQRRRWTVAGQGRAHDATVWIERERQQSYWRRCGFERRRSDHIVTGSDAAEYDAWIAGEQFAEWRIAGRFEDADGC